MSCEKDLHKPQGCQEKHIQNYWQYFTGIGKTLSGAFLYNPIRNALSERIPR